MAGLIQDAWSGWTSYTDNGKLPALLLAVLLYLWFGRKQKGQWAFLVYTSITAVCCIIPVTAGLLMAYQTRFYNYEWIWSLVPVTAAVAYGAACFWTEYRAGFCPAENAGQWKRTGPAALLLLAVVLFCGSMGRQAWDRDGQKAERIQAYAVLGQLSERYTGAELCLWAPREIMEYAREKDASIRLLYGRNIWDGFLDGYAYDTYDDDTVILEQWMEKVSVTGAADLKIITVEECAAKALSRGVNCILLAADASHETVSRMEAALGVKAEQLEGYYLFVYR